MTTEKLQFRAATAADTDAIVALTESAYRGDSGRRGWTTEADLLDGRRTGPDEIDIILNTPRNMILLAETGTPPVLVASIHIADRNGVGYLGMFSVNPTLQGGGIGKRVFEEAERIVRDELKLPMIEGMVIHVREELLQYYVRLGYQRTGEFTPFPYGDARFGVPKVEGLQFETIRKIF